MIKLFDGVYNRVIRDATLFKIVDDKTDPKRPVSFFRLAYFDEDKEHKTLVFNQRSEGYLEINGNKYWYTDMLDHWDLIQALITQENNIRAIDTLP